MSFTKRLQRFSCAFFWQCPLQWRTINGNLG
uniref:Uncharacterized protein n=1 Tax=Anguilla anguilla TaxID=7936 RepID=A0A0E9THI7_ANGAN